MVRMMALALILMGSGVAKADVAQINRAGPTCDGGLQACTLVVQITGEINDTAVAQLQRIVTRTRQEAAANGYFFSFLSIELNSPGGSVNAAMKIGGIARKEGPAVVVNRDAICLSACVLILAGGSFREINGIVGIHRPYFAVPRDEISAESTRAAFQTMLGDIRAYLREMNVAEGLADDMLHINPEDMRLLTRTDLMNYGLTEVDPVAMETFDLEQAQKYGLDTQEYMRRKKEAETQCGGPASIATGCYQSILKTGSWQQPDFSRYGVPAR